MWFVCVTAGVVATVVVIFSLWDKFQTNPTITGLDTDFHNWQVPFPAIVLCPDEPASIETIRDVLRVENTTGSENDLKVQYLHDFSRLSLKTIHQFTEDHWARLFNFFVSPVDPRALSLKLLDSCDGVFAACKFKNRPLDCCEQFKPVLTESGLCYAFNSRHFARTGSRGASFNMQYIKETDIKWSLEFSVRSRQVAMGIYIVNSDDMIGIDVQPHLIWDYTVDKVLFSIKQTYTTEDTRQLSIKQRRCVFADEIKLNVDQIYTYTACTIQCRMDRVGKFCDCVPFFYPETSGFVDCPMKRPSCLIMYWNDIENAQCDCQLGCNNTVYEVEALSTKPIDSTINRLEIGFVSWPIVRYKREVLFGWVDLLVSFGGIAGLFLGFSILSIVELVYYFTIRAVIAAFRERNYLDRIRRQYREKPQPALDLNLVPNFVSKHLPGHGVDLIKGHLDAKKSKNRIIHVEMMPPPFGIEFVN